MWKEAWWLVGKEMKFQWRAFVSTGIATVFISLIVVSSFVPYAGDFNGQSALVQHWFLIDLIFVGITPAFAALFMSSPYLSVRTIKEDPFGKRMAVYRSLPIPIDVLSRSRVLLMLITLVIMSTLFYGTFLILLPDSIFAVISIREIVLFILTWFGYAAAMGGLNAYIEFGTNGKVLWIFPFIFMLLFLAAEIVFHQMVDSGIVEWSLFLVRDYGLPAVVISLLLGILGCIATNIMLKKRLLKKDYV